MLMLKWACWEFYICYSKYKKPSKPFGFEGFCGGDDRTRICDPLRVKQVLYRLSYASI